MIKKTPYQIALVGMSGRGKTMAFRNMNPQTCGFINIEGKPLPFINNFEHYCTPSTWQETYQKLIEYAKNDKITEVVLDSFSAYTDSLLKTCRETKRGFDIWSMYNEEIGKLLYIIKKYPKDLITTAHYEWVEDEGGAVEKRIMVKAKEWRGMVEKDFTIVNYADLRMIENKRHYYIQLNSDGKSSAKTPPMFLEDDKNEIENDMNSFLQNIRTVLNK